MKSKSSTKLLKIRLKKEIENSLFSYYENYHESVAIQYASAKKKAQENAEHFIDIIYELLKETSSPQTKVLEHASVSFIWSYSERPIQEIEICIQKDSLSLILEDEVEDIRLYKEFPFSDKPKTLPPKVMGYLKSFLKKT